MFIFNVISCSTSLLIGLACIKHPFLLKLKKEKNLKIIGVNFKDKKDHAITFLNNLGNPYHYLAKDKLGKQSIFFGVYGIPESILISSDLVIKKKFLGPISEEDYKKIKDMININWPLII